MKVQEGKFKLQDLLVVPMQRVLKYHLLLKVGPRVVKRNVLREIMEALCYKMNLSRRSFAAPQLFNLQLSSDGPSLKVEQQ